VGAGRLIDQAGLKGSRIGGAEVSPKHANFIVNTGNATASDVLRLIKHVQEEVKRKLGYMLETEITVIGER
ncbi:MAG: UDP-N-acetylenolpyruvoylglucosamine reductase, partial [Planctomycetota bacterium]